ncbi:MtrB/PioB family outer membrane beta-barrel protein [Desulfobulbus oligotrophicus]|uniref:Outer membrane beta-barrel protein n=1 Tax=Desulfobulbus oligotrophicus TaxID=1909699 RepID=A0A7T5VBB9_9BACT|nr:outer membrane beta-barrel protein [Desulfobulbus oligotrophicus]QQG64723.1 outer membrane beta-barrel protein [Desulfobulbus oligotrophicus]
MITRIGAFVLAVVGMAGMNEAWARQNIAIGELTIGYDYQDRNYKNGDHRYSSESDARNLFASPRIRLSSRGSSDLLEFTYAPSFTYDDADNSNFVGHDLGLLAEKNITRDWLVQVTDSYYKGEDTVGDYTQRRAAIMPEPEGSMSTPPIGAGPIDDGIREFSDIYGRQRYWRNDLSLRTDYTYAQDSIVGLEYRYGVLRYDDDAGRRDSDYDRHEGVGRLSYRFDTNWHGESEFSYVKGIYDEIDADSPDAVDEDLEEYHAMLRLNYRWRPHDIYFGRYMYTKTAYEDEVYEDSTIHAFTFGWDHDFSPRLSTTLSGGPSIVTFENSGDETGYNAYAGLRWAVSPISNLSVHVAHDYEFDNFDTRQVGLTKTWSSGLAFDHRFTPHLGTTLSGGYARSKHEHPAVAGLPEEYDRFDYTEKIYHVGVAMQYNFLQRYTLAASYRYADHSEPGDEYDEHRFFLSLTAATELWRW